jgi:MFS transporter, DHA1 family, solute carrier family 18 (vesicular amine transporter), member 1/2
MVVPAFLSPVIGYLSDHYGRKSISAAGLITMAVISPVLAVKYSSVYQIIPPLMIFGLSSPMTLTPILPEMGEVVHEIVSLICLCFGSYFLHCFADRG